MWRAERKAALNEQDNRNADAQDMGKQIGDSVRAAFQSGDFSKLKNLGPTVQQAVRRATSGIGANTRSYTAWQGQPGNTHKPPQAKGQTQPWQQSQNRSAQTPQHYPHQQGYTVPAKRQKDPNAYAGVGSIVLGTMGVVAFGASLVVVGILAAVGLFGGAGVWLSGLLAGAALTCGGIIAGGTSKRALARRLRQYGQLLQENHGVATLDDLAAKTGIEPQKIKRDIRRGQNKGMLPAGVRMDDKETCVIAGEEPYRLYRQAEEARLQREREALMLESDPEAAALEKFKSDGKTALKNIRQANDAIPGEEISEKIDELELTASKIFSYVEAHPQKLPETRKLMNYYLPTTVKLLEKYRQYDEMEVKLPNVESTKREIEASLDTINIAFTNLLASLYQDDTLDVSTDIQVLQTMLRQEGLAGRRFTVKPVELTKEEDNT